MPLTKTAFNAKKSHIHLKVLLVSPEGKLKTARAVLDSGAPQSEFSDDFLKLSGFLNKTTSSVSIKSQLQTQKYKKIILPHLEICNQTLKKHPVYVSRFEKSRGIDALIGLDFFRRFRTTIDYQKGEIHTEALYL